MNNEAKLIGAIKFAAHAHRNQRRRDKNASPYVNHPIELVSILSCEVGINEIETLQAAILHDTIEDTETTYEEIKELFGVRVANIVLELTDDMTQLKAVRKQSQIDRSPHKSNAAAQIKCADKIANLRDTIDSPPDWSLEKKREYFDWSKKVVEALPAVELELQFLFEKAYAKRP